MRKYPFVGLLFIENLSIYRHRKQLKRQATHDYAPSTMEQMYTKTRSILRRLDELESCLSSRVARHRRRATNLLDVTPSTRRTHVR